MKENGLFPKVKLASCGTLSGFSFVSFLRNSSGEQWPLEIRDRQEITNRSVALTCSLASLIEHLGNREVVAPCPAKIIDLSMG